MASLDEVAGPVCPICYHTIGPEEDESFLDTCMHSFCYSCITKWTEIQRLGGAPFLCPVCRQGYHSIVHDCRGPDAFVRQWVVEQAAAPAAGPPPWGRAAQPQPQALQLTVGHRRRRSVYFVQPDPVEHESLARAMITPEMVARQDVVAWTERELQALVQQRDVALVAAHATGTLRAAAAAKPAQRQAAAGVPGGRGPGRDATLLRGARIAVGPPGRGAGGAARAAGASVAEVVQQVEAAVRPFIFEHAERFSWELAAFAASGATIAAFDQRAMAAGTAAAARAVAEARAQLARRQEWWQGGEQQQQGQEQQEQQEQQTAGDGRRVQSSEGPGDSMPASSTESGGRGPVADGEAQRSDSEGYLELLVLQGRRRSQRQAQPAEPQEEGQEASSREQVRQEQQREAVSPLPHKGSSREAHRKHKRRRSDSRLEQAGAAGWELAALRQSALESLQHHRSPEEQNSASHTVPR
eukprot:scaffold13.g343.t1